MGISLSALYIRVPPFAKQIELLTLLFGKSKRGGYCERALIGESVGWLECVCVLVGPGRKGEGEIKIISSSLTDDFCSFVNFYPLTKCTDFCGIKKAHYDISIILR